MLTPSCALLIAGAAGAFVIYINPLRPEVLGVPIILSQVT